MSTPAYNLPFDIEQIGEALLAYHGRNPKSYFEIRVLKPKGGGNVASGYFQANNIVAAAAEAARFSGKADAIYFTPNPVKRAVYARSPNKIVTWAKVTTTDAEIERRSHLLIDFDAVRPAGISSTNAEHAAALKLAAEVTGWLTGNGWPDPIKADSGNGAHLTYRVELFNTAANTNLFRDFLTALARRFDSKKVKIDRSVFNPARIWKLPGTLVCKGADVRERPWRLAAMLSVPERIELVTGDMIGDIIRAAGSAKVIAIRDDQDKGITDKRNGRPLWTDIEPIFSERITKKKDPRPDGSFIIEIKGCPFSKAGHPEDRAGWFTVFANGTFWPGCFHNNCQGKGLKETLAEYAPDLLEAFDKEKRTWEEIQQDVLDNQIPDVVARAKTEGNGALLLVSKEKFAAIQAEISESIG